MILYQIVRLAEMLVNRKRILFEDENKNLPQWVAVYHLGYAEFDDMPDESDFTEAVFTAPNFDIAVRYAQQYLRKMQTEEETSEQWANAQILSVELH